MYKETHGFETKDVYFTKTLSFSLFSDRVSVSLLAEVASPLFGRKNKLKEYKTASFKEKTNTWVKCQLKPGGEFLIKCSV